MTSGLLDDHADILWISDMGASLEAKCAAGRVRHRADTVYMLVMAARVIMMQTGYALMESGSVRPINGSNIMMKGFVDLLLGAAAWYVVGDEIAYPHSQNDLDGDPSWTFDFARWFLNVSYVVTAATINSAALAERVSFLPHAVYVATFVFIVYPIAVRWVWGGGWLADEGFIDFAGGAVVHLVGAVSALVACCICGPRIGRFDGYRGWRGIARYVFMQRHPDTYFKMPEAEELGVFRSIQRCSNPVQLLYGVLSLLVGFIALTPAATNTVDANDLLAARLTVIQLLAAASGSVAAYIASIIKTRSSVVTVPELAQAIIGASVSVCACANVLTPGAAMVVGFVGAALALISGRLIEMAQIDDPIQVVSAHGLPGLWGVLCVAIFAKPHCHSDLRGLLYGGGEGAWKLLGTQVVGLCSLAGWTAFSTYICTLLVDMLCSLRCSRAAELVGLDFTEHAYDHGNSARSIQKLSHALEKDSLMHRAMGACFGERNFIGARLRRKAKRMRLSVSSIGSRSKESAGAEPEEDEGKVEEAIAEHEDRDGEGSLSNEADDGCGDEDSPPSPDDIVPKESEVVTLRKAIGTAMKQIQLLKEELDYAKEQHVLSDEELWGALRWLNSREARKEDAADPSSGDIHFTTSLSPRQSRRIPSASKEQLAAGAAAAAAAAGAGAGAGDPRPSPRQPDDGGDDHAEVHSKLDDHVLQLALSQKLGQKLEQGQPPVVSVTFVDPAETEDAYEVLFL